MQAGQFIRWDAEDFSYTGMVIEHTEDNVVRMLTEHGEMGFVMGDGEVYDVRRPKNFSFTGNPQDLMPKPKAKKVAKAPKAGSNKAKAIELFATVDTLPSRKDGIRQIADALGVSEAYASTLFNDVKKAR